MWCSFVALCADVRIKHASLKCDFKQDIIDRMVFNFNNPSCGAAVMEGNVAFFLAQNSKMLHKVTLPTEPPKKVIFPPALLNIIMNPFKYVWFVCHIP